MESISVNDLAALGPDVFIVDLRDGEEYAEARAPGAVNIPLSHFQQSPGDVPIRRAAHVICASGGR